MCFEAYNAQWLETCYRNRSGRSLYHSKTGCAMSQTLIPSATMKTQQRVAI